MINGIMLTAEIHLGEHLDRLRHKIESIGFLDGFLDLIRLLLHVVLQPLRYLDQLVV